MLARAWVWTGGAAALALVAMGGCSQGSSPFPSLPLPGQGTSGILTPAQQQKAIDDLRQAGNGAADPVPANAWEPTAQPGQSAAKVTEAGA